MSAVIKRNYCEKATKFEKKIFHSDPYKTLLDWLAQSYAESCVLTHFLELVMLFEIANINRFPVPVQQKTSVP